ncbi:hypothetical protein N7493_011076 [Penicillium malachiteum]|uniref:Uncharacterized protein n=1 Tax=Penicillium malachiteum TaxID=1324776 RepID=A0AAD6HBG9_9EURO|nr:hypothetical protein N7493_011076 [Penicillium malachiteum]
MTPCDNTKLLIIGAVELFASSNQTNIGSSSGLSAGVKGAIGGGVAAGVLLVCAGMKENPEYTKSEAKGLVELGDEVAQEIGSGNMSYEKAADPSGLRREFESDNTIFERPADIQRY